MRLTPNRFNTALQILALAIIARLVVALTLGISDDEAWYWAISKNHQASYVVHPPLMMWILSFSTKVFGDNIFAIRIPSLLLSGWGSLMLLVLCYKMHWEKGSHITSLLCLSAPILFLGGILTGPDLPLFAFWITSMVLTYDVIKREDNGVSPRAPSLFKWLALGICLGLCLLSKFTGVFAVFAFVLSLISTTEGRKRLLSFGPYIAILTCAVIFVPVLAWNMTNDWSSFRFQFIERHSGEINFRRWLVFWASQFFLYGPVLFMGWFLIIKKSLLPQLLDTEIRKIRFLAIWAVLPGLMFFTQPLVSDFKIHWALFAYIPIAVFAAKLYTDYQHTRLVRLGFYFTFGFAFFGMLCFYVPVLPKTTYFLTHQTLDPKHDITNDFYGWKTWVDYQKHNLPNEMKDLLIVTSRYQSAAQAAFSLGDKSRVALIPHNSFENQDWQGATEVPEKFLYLNDNRYNDSPEPTYPEHQCSPTLSYEKTRGGFLAKKIDLYYCVKKTI